MSESSYRHEHRHIQEEVHVVVGPVLTPMPIQGRTLAETGEAASARQETQANATAAGAQEAAHTPGAVSSCSSNSPSGSCRMGVRHTMQRAAVMIYLAKCIHMVR